MNSYNLLSLPYKKNDIINFLFLSSSAIWVFVPLLTVGKFKHTLGGKFKFQMMTSQTRDASLAANPQETGWGVCVTMLDKKIMVRKFKIQTNDVTSVERGMMSQSPRPLMARKNTRGKKNEIQQVLMYKKKQQRYYLYKKKKAKNVTLCRRRRQCPTHAP